MMKTVPMVEKSLRDLVYNTPTLTILKEKVEEIFGMIPLKP
jgi:hypothetical protein